jgi:putative phosphoesterase
VILGILADTHGFHRRAARAIHILERLGAEAFVHCGDIGGEDVLAELAGRRAWFVWGNTDAPDPGLIRYAESLGLTPPQGVPAQLEIDGRRLAVFHGHERPFEAMIRRVRQGDHDAIAALGGKFDYVLHGHTHRPADARAGSIRVINPGALERAQPYTVATLDVPRDLLRFWQVDETADATQPPQPFSPA